MWKSALVVSVLIMLGRLAGFAREWLIAMRAGANDEADIAITLLTFPDLMIGILLGGGLAAALVPRFSGLPEAERSALLLRLSVWIGAVFVLLAAGVAVAAGPLLSMLLPGKPLPVLVAAQQPFMLVALAMPLAALSGLLVAFLNANRRFALGASGTLWFNGCLILALLLWPGQQLVVAITVGVLAGAALRLLVQSFGVRSHWHHPVWSKGHIDRALLVRFAACFGFSTLLVLLPPIARALASYGQPGSVALFNFAHKLIELPMGVVIGAIATVLLPTLAASHIRSGVADAQAHAAAAIRLTIQCTLAVSIPAIIFADEVVRVVYFKAAFVSEQFSQLALLTSIGFLALPLQGLISVFGTSFAAIGRTRPLLTAGLLILCAFGLSADWAQGRWQLPGLMAAYVFAYAVGTAILVFQLGRHMGGGVWHLVFRRSLATFYMPIILAITVALVIDHLVSGLVWRVIAAVLVSLVFFATTLAFNLEGWRQLPSAARKVSDSPDDDR